MKNVISTLAATTILLSSCSKNDKELFEDSTVSSTSLASVQTSNWQPANTWQYSVGDDKEKVYSTTFSNSAITPEVRTKGAVVLYAKGYNFTGENAPADPMGLPWYYYIPWERMAYPYYWEEDIKDGSATVRVKMHQDIEQAYLDHRKNLQFRYFILPEAFLKQHNLTQASAKQLSYQEMVAKTGTTP